MQVPPTFKVVKTATAELKTIALTLANGGWLTPAMYKKRRGDLSACVADAVSSVANAARPQPLTDLSASVADVEFANIGDHQPGTDRPTHTHVILVHGHCDRPIHRLIGPKIQALEKFRPGLGHTVLHWLSEALDKTTRACDPITGLGWAQDNYWMGEDDESFYVEEQLAEHRDYYETQQAELPEAQRKPFDEAAALKELGTLTKAEFEGKIPREIHSLRKPKLTIAQLRRVKLPRKPKTLGEVFSNAPDLITGTIAAAQLCAAAPHSSQMHDGGDFEQMRWNICPFLLRWQRGEVDPQKKVGDWVQDHLGMIWDDAMNREYEGGDTNMEAIAAWGFHDGPSLNDAMHRFDRWCRLLQAAETLLNLIQPEEIKS